MLAQGAVPTVADLPPAQIVKVREQTGVSQAALAGFLNVAVNTVSHWERGERLLTGAARKLRHVVNTKGLGVVRCRIAPAIYHPSQGSEW